MEADRWQTLQALFEQAVARPSDQRAAFVAQACGGDARLAAELGRLLAVDAQQAGAARDAPAATSADPVQAAIAQAAAGWACAQHGSRAGERLGPWRIAEHLADGGMGAVYRGERADGQYEQQVAIKLLNPAFVSAQARARLAQERQILARLSHPHIARLLDGGDTADGVPYLVMEFVDGVPIDRWCEAHAPRLRDRLRLFALVCRTVDHAHRNLVVHRDLKPSNILVDAEGSPRLLDFGIAKLAEVNARVTVSGERLLTPMHASPEQVSGRAITTATDIYALGVLLYDLLTGRLPHPQTTGNPAALARAIVDTPPTRPSAAVGSGAREAALQARAGRLTPERLARELEGDLDNIVLMALRKEPERRYASAAEFADDIERHLAHLPVRARPDTLAYRGAKFWRRHPVAMPASLLAAAAAMAAGALFTWRLADERDRALASEARAQKAARFAASVLERTGALNDAEREISVRELLDRAAERVGSELADDPMLATRMRTALGAAYSSWGEYERSMNVLEPALAEARARGAGGELDAAELMLQLGTVTHDLGRLEESLGWTREAEALLRRVGTAAQQGRALGDIAIALNALRRRSEAEPVFKQALELLRAAHRDGAQAAAEVTAASAMSAASAEPAASAESAPGAVAGAPRPRRGDHGDIAWLLNNYGWCLHAMGRLDEALPLYEEALAMQWRLGTAPAERLQTQNNLAGVYYDRGDLERAGAMWQEVLHGYEAVFGTGGHAAVARSQNMVALVAIDQGRFEDAAALTAAALATNRKLLGERHRWTATTMQSHAVAMIGLGRLEEGERLLRSSLTVRSEVLPAGHVDNAGPLLALARLALQRGQLRRAEEHARAALALIERMASPDRAPLERVLWTLGRAVARQGRVDEGRALAERALARLRERVPATHPRRLAAEAAIGLPPFAAHASREARERAASTLAALSSRLGPRAEVMLELRTQLETMP